jgi:GNAT superfamily N-acetyltransferase
MTMVINHRPPAYLKEGILLDGKKVTIRPINSKDKPALQKFHQRLSEDTRFLRYHYSKGPLTEDDLKNYCDLDYDNSLGLVAEDNVDGHREIIGVGRYIRLANPEIAEVAFVVQDDEQKKGVGTLLLQHLSILACQRGVRFFVGEVLRQNARMLSIFRKADPGMGHEVDSVTTCNVTLSVPGIVQGAS